MPAVEDIGARSERVGPGTAAGAEVALVEEVGGRAEFLGQPGHFDPADGHRAVVVAGDGAGPDLLVEDVQVGGRGCVVPLGQDVGVTGTGGVCGSAHGVALFSRISQRCSGALIPSRDRPCGQHRPGGLGNGQPGSVGGRGFLVADGQRGRGVLEVEEGVRDVFEMSGEPVGRAVAGGGGEGLGVVGQRAQQCGCVDILVVQTAESEERGAAGERAGPGVGVADEEQRVSGALYEQLVAERGPVVPGRPQQPPPDGIGPEPLQQFARRGTGGKRPDDGGRRSRLPRGVDFDPEPRPVGVGRPVAAGAYQRALCAGDATKRVGGDRGPDLAGMAQLQDVPGERVPVPVPGPRASTSCTSASRIRASAEASSVKFRNPGPVTSTRPIPGAPATRSRRISATSRPRGGPGQLSATAQA